MSVRRKFTRLIVLGLAVWLAGCGRETNVNYGAEIDDPGYREGEQLKKQGRTQEALAAYLKVIEKRGDQAAAESHLEVGLILQQTIKDPLEAIHHFRKYLEQQPNSRQAPLVKQRIEAAKREFARTLPAQPLESQAARLDGFDQLDRLQRENEQLKAELVATRTGSDFVRPTNSMRVPVGDQPESKLTPVAVAPAEEPSPIILAPMGPRETDAPLAVQTPPAPIAASTTPVAPAPAARPLSKPTAPAAAAGGRRHTVAPKGDTLYGIAKQYYGVANNAKVQAILQANRDVLPSAEALRPGMVLRIP